jgi:hypothetical protein
VDRPTKHTVPVAIDWNAVTGTGTILVAVTAVVVAIWSDRQQGRRLTRQQATSDEKLAAERAHSDAAVREERRLVLEREQFAEASLVEVVAAVKKPGMNFGSLDRVPQLTVSVRNRGKYTITDIAPWAVLREGNGWQLVKLIEPRQEQHWDSSNPKTEYVEPVPGTHPDWLPPWDARLVYSTALASPSSFENENWVPSYWRVGSTVGGRIGKAGKAVFCERPARP